MVTEITGEANSTFFPTSFKVIQPPSSSILPRIFFSFAKYLISRIITESNLQYFFQMGEFK